MSESSEDKTSALSLFPADVVEYLHEAGYRGKTGCDGRDFVDTASSGYNFRVYFYEPVDRDPDNGFSAFMFDLGVRISRYSNIPELNELCQKFNYDHRYVKVFLPGYPEKEVVVMQMDARVNNEPLEAFRAAFDFFLFAINKLDDIIVKSDAYRGDQLHVKHTAAINLLWGADRDPEEAVTLYREAAQGGYAGSQNNLGDLYETGDIVAKSKHYAIYWYTRAAERGEPTAYVSLATLLSEIADDDNMVVDAAKFAILAIEQLPEGKNKEVAQKCFGELQKVMSDEQFRQAEELARAWKPLFQETRLLSDAPDKTSHPEMTNQVLH